MVFISQMKKLPMQVTHQVKNSLYFGLGSKGKKRGRRKATGGPAGTSIPIYIQGGTLQEGRKSVPTLPVLFCSFTGLSSGNLHVLLPEKFGLLPPSSASSPGAFALLGIWREGRGGSRWEGTEELGSTS